MSCLKLFVFMVLCIHITFGKECNHQDNACMIRGASAAYPLFVKGIDNVVEPSDPLILDSINADSANLMYKLQNAKMTGLKDCATTTLMLQEADRSFLYTLECPKVELNADYTMSGTLGGMALQSAGPMKMTAEKYEMKFKGIYDKNTDSKGIEHVSIKSYEVDIGAKGRVLYEFNNLKENSDAVNKYINENWKEKELQAPLHTLTELFIGRLNTFLGIIPKAELYADLS